MFRTHLGLGRLMAAGAIAAVAAFSAQPASAQILDGWTVNLETINDEGVFTGLVSNTDIDHINVVGSDTVIQQTVVGGSALGQPFVESGVLQWNSTSPEGGGGVTNFSLGTATALYVQFTDLTGVLNNDGTITFDTPNTGTVILWLDDDNDLDPTTGTSQQIAEFAIIAPSGGSDLDFFGGGGANATVDITLELISQIDDDLFLDENGDPIAPGSSIHLVNTDSLLVSQEDFIDENGDGFTLLEVQNNGQWNIAQEIPEPSTIGLLAFGLSALGFFMRRRRPTDDVEG